jgi:hypothetical protein
LRAEGAGGHRGDFTLPGRSGGGGAGGRMRMQSLRQVVYT